MPNFSEIQNIQADHVRKSLQGGAFVNPNLTDPPLLAITSATDKGLIDLSDSNYEGLGYLTADGMSHSRESASSDVTSFGFTTPTRTDITNDTTTITLAAQETKLLTIGLATGSDMSAVTPKAGSGEIVIRKPQRPSPKTYRLLTLAVDLGEHGEIYIGRFFPRAKVTAFSDQVFGSGDEALLWGVTFTAQFDSTLGFSESWHFGGPGWAPLLTSMGFPALGA